MISVIIPVFNAEKTIVKSLLSVKNQSWKGDFEIIVVNDGSTDNSRTVIEKFIQENPDQNIKLIDQENGGVSKARNAALKICNGDFIALLDADDEWFPSKIQSQMNAFEDSNLEIDFMATFCNNEKNIFPWKKGSTRNLIKITLCKLLLKITGHTSTALFKNKILENTGYFDENQRYSEDANYWMRISKKNQMYLLCERLVLAGNGKKSFGSSGLSANLKEMEKGIQKNISEMYKSGRINFFQYVFYFVISKLKYWIRPLRAKL